MINDSFSLEHKFFLVTGASSGLGAKTAISITERGGKVIITGRNEERLNKTFSSLYKTGHIKIIADLTKEKDVERLVQNIDQLDGIVHCSGIVKPFPVKFISKKQIQEVFEINYNAPLALTTALFKKKKINDSSSLVFISSVSSHFAHVGGALYAGSKSAINALSKTLALEYAHKKIRSNVILAGMIQTPVLEGLVSLFGNDVLKKNQGQYPLGYGQTEDVANAVIYLLSPASKWITGTELVLDGGLTAGI